MIKIVEPDHRPDTLAPRADGTCGCSCACNCVTGDQAGSQSTKSAKDDVGALPVVLGKRDGA
ncbi:MAG: hypothetical protein IPH09_16235 [bacterium]|nr:hypothetical protein [bacterium]MBK7702393.1 hypothetical protein [bacterium]MBK9305434.1 hypothetical protein [bacterium]